MPKVVITEGPGSGKFYDIEHAVILGRLDTNDIPVLDKKASREHAKIYRQGQQFAIVDLNSSNGTFVNDEKITKRILKPGDEIGIGTVRMRFEQPEEVKEASSDRMSLDAAFSAAAATKDAPSATGGGGKPPDIVLKSHQPIQYSRIKPGNPILGFDFDQLSEGGRIIIWSILLIVFAVLIYLSYTFIAA
ncbi:MAG: FHA domain-containing protein [Planctomycetota bacterium]